VGCSPEEGQPVQCFSFMVKNFYFWQRNWEKNIFLV
jgi:hypothetical protein